MTDILIDVTLLFINAMQKSPNLRLAILIVSGIVSAILAYLLFTAEFYFYAIAAGIRQVGPILIVFSIVLFFLTLVSFTSVKLKGSRFAEFDIESLRQERKVIEQRISKSSKEDIVGTIQLSLNQLTEYYAINKSQARSSFGWSIFAIVIGLATLIGGVWLFYLNGTPNIQLTAITGLASIIAEFIGASYFFLYNKSLNQLNSFYAQLIKLQDTMLSIRLMEDFKDQAKQEEVREKLIMTLINRGNNWASTSNVDATSLKTQ